MPSGVYERKKYPILCHPDVKRHVMGHCINCYSKVLRLKNPEYEKSQKAYSKKRYDKLGSKIVNKDNVSLQRQWRIKAVEKLGNKCKHCGFSDMRALQIDHVNGDGHKERQTRKSLNRKIALSLIDTSRYQILCANCNWIKRVENNETKKTE